VSYEKVQLKHVILTVWRTPEFADGAALVNAAKEASGALERPILFVSLAPPDSPPPPDDLRKYMGEHVKEMLEYCSELHIIIEGKGFGHSMKRMAMASIVLISGMRKKMHVHDSIAVAQASMASGDREAFGLSVKRAQLEGFLSSHEPESSRSQRV
jgi:hypothetical protein